MSGSWKLRRSSFGEYIEIPMPPDCDVVLICVDTVQHEPVAILLPGQVYVARIREIMDEHNAKSVTIMPYQNATKVEVTKAALRRRAAK